VKRQKRETRTRKKARIGSRATALSEEGRNQQESNQGKESEVENKKKWLKKLDSEKQKKGNWIQKSRKKRENDDLQWRKG